MASILSQYKVYFCPHEPLLFLCRLLLPSISQLFHVNSASSSPLRRLLGAHGSLAHIIY